MPHGHCFLWQPDILWLHVLSDGVAAASYFAIPFVLIYLLGKRKDIPFQNIFLLFAAFILFCGLTHVLNIWVLWHPDYAIEGVTKALTALASISTFFVLIRLVPRIISIPSPAQLAVINKQLQDANHKLGALYKQNKTNSDSYLQVIVNTVLDGLITIDENGTIQTFNSSAIRIFGYQPEEVIGQNVKMLMPEPYHSGHDGYLHNYLSTGEKKVIGIGREVSGKRKDGSVFPMELGINEMQIEGARMFVGTVRDITDRKNAERQLKEESARMLAVMNTVLDGLITIDERGAIQTFNPAAARIFGYQPEEVIGQNVKMLMPEPYHSGHDGYLHNYLSTGEKKVIGIGREVSGKRRDGSVFPMELGINEMQVAGMRMFVGTVRDLSERKSMLASLSSQMTAISKTQAVVEFSMDGTIITANQNFLDLMGYTLEEIKGSHHSMFVSADYKKSKEYSNFWSILRRGDYQTAEYMRLGKGGKEIWLLSFYNPVMDANGNPWKVVKFSIDISDRKNAERQLKEESARMLAVMNTVLDGLITIDERGTIQTFNPAAARVFGYQPEEVIGQNVKMLMPEPYHSGHDGYLHNYLSTGEKKVIGIGREVSGKRRDGSVFPMELGINEMHVVGKRMFVGTVRDISERKEAEQEIQQYLAALKRSNQELDDFAYIASHDLKEPLRGLSNNVMFLKEDYQDKIEEDGLNRFSRMTYLCERMERLVNDLLYFSRLGRQELAVQTTDLNGVIRDIESMMESTLSEANVKIIIPEKLPSITCDLPRITEVFRNLITNAVKYNDKPEKRVEIGSEVKDGERVFFVRDNGVGIPKHFYNDVFRIFKRLNDEDDNIKGTGVGLTFVKKIIERHDGRIWIESEMGKGTTFYFTIHEPQGA